MKRALACVSKLSLAVGGLALIASLGCGSGPKRGEAEAHDPTGAGGAESGRDGVGSAAGSGARSGGEDGPSAPRTVSLRSPFGNVEPGNLLMNGDFELGIGAVVPGWYAVADNHVMPFRYRTGGICRSGLLCAEIASGQSLVATMVSLPAAGPVTITAFAKPRAGRPEDVTVRLTLQGLAGNALGALLLERLPGVDRTGFHQYEASFDVDRAYDVVSLVVEARDSTLVDDVSVRAGAPEARRPFAWPDSHSLPTSVDRVIRLAHEEARTRRAAPTARAALAPPTRPPPATPAPALAR